MVNPNIHTQEYLTYYCNEINNPGFAVLLKGEWGSGKTWFIKNFIDKAQDKFLYISLYGLKETKEIDDLIFEKLHPVLGSKSVVIIGKLAKSALRLGFKIDIDDASNIKELIDLAGKISNKILVFDDLERNNIDSNSLLGYLNSFIEHQGLKVILIGNENKLKESGDNYDKSKEKVIGQTFEIYPLVKEAIDAFIEEIQDAKCKEYLRDNVLLIEDVFSKVGYRNLRDLRQSLFSFEYLYRKIDDSYKTEIKFMNSVLEIICYSFLEYKANMINPENWELSIELFFNKGMSQQSFLKLSPEDQKQLSPSTIFSVFFTKHYIPIKNSIYDLIFNGKLSAESLNIEIKDSKYFIKKNESNLQILLSKYRDFSPEEFQRIFTEFLIELNSKIYYRTGELFYSTGLLLFFSKSRLISISSQKIVQMMAKIIDELYVSEKLEDNESYGLNLNNFNGFLFSERERTRFNKILKDLKNKSQGLKEKKLKKEFAIAINKFPDSFVEFCQSLRLIGGFDNKYSPYPVLSWIDTRDFFNRFLLLPGEYKDKFINTLRERYEMQFSNGELRKELYIEKEFLVKFKELLMKKISNEDFNMNPPVVYLNSVLDEVKLMLEYFDKKMALKDVKKSKK